MAGVILSRSKYAEKPYYITNMSINIYSLEELCYYIYNNIYLIGTDLVDDGLISYIDNELEEPELGETASVPSIRGSRTVRDCDDDSSLCGLL